MVTAVTVVTTGDRGDCDDSGDHQHINTPHNDQNEQMKNVTKGGCKAVSCLSKRFLSIKVQKDTKETSILPKIEAQLTREAVSKLKSLEKIMR